MEGNEETKQQLEAAYKQIEMHLEEGVSYFVTYTVTTYGVAGGRVFSLENDLRVYLDDEKLEHLDLFKVTKSFPAHTIVKYTFIKGSPVKVEACSPEMLLHEMKLELKARQKQHEEVLRVTNSPAEGLLNIETRVKFLKNGKMDILEKEIRANGSASEELYSCIEDELRAMYFALDGNLKKMFVSLTGDELIVQTTPAIPGLTNEVIEKKADLKLDASNLKAIYTFLESHHDEKIAKALEALETNPELKETAEKRYLHFIRARLHDASAVLAQFPEAALSRSEVETLTGKHFAKDFISLSYFDDSESKLAVDFIGSMIQNAIDLNVYAEQANQLTNPDELVTLYDDFAAQAKNAITEEVKNCPKGWFSEVSKHLVKLKLKRVLFEKTQFDEANRSLALKGFIFFLNINCKTSVYLDIFQSDTPKLTEMFWMLRAVPQSNWGDVSPEFPDSTLKFQRSASYRIGDDGSWEIISKP